MNNKKILITGVAGFIGFHFTKKLIERNYKIIGIDDLNDYYDKKLKLSRLSLVKKNIIFYKTNINKISSLKKIFKKHKPNIVLNLAAQAGVRHSVKNPQKYIDSNIQGFHNLLELSKEYGVKNFFYASSSSVYGKNKTPFSEKNPTERPLSFYAVTKKFNEQLAYYYSYFYQIQTTGFRFFTVYGPWGRPDMSLFKFVKSILNNRKIVIFNNGKMKRDFTYIDDAIDLSLSIFEKKIKIKNSIQKFDLFNIANSKPVGILKYIKIIEKQLNVKAKINYVNNVKTEVKETHSDKKKLFAYIKKKKCHTINDGIKKFISWYKYYYKI